MKFLLNTDINLEFHQNFSINIWYAHTYLLFTVHTHIHAHTHTRTKRYTFLFTVLLTVLYPAQCSDGALPLITFPSPLIILMVFHHGLLHACTTSRSHTGSREENRRYLFSCPVCLSDQKWQWENIAVASLPQAQIITIRLSQLPLTLRGRPLKLTAITSLMHCGQTTTVWFASGFCENVCQLGHTVTEFWHLFNCNGIPKIKQCAVSFWLHCLHLHVLCSQSLNCHLAPQAIIFLPAITLGKFNRDVQMYCDELWPWWRGRISSPLCEVCYVEVG